MADLEGRASYWNGKLVGVPNKIYYDLINVDPVAPPYTERLRPTSYFLKKRKPYKTSFYIRTLLENLGKGSGWVATDIIEMDESDCKQDYGWVVVHLINESLQKKEIVAFRDNECVGSGNLKVLYTGNYENKGCRCECNYDKLVVTDFVKGEPKYIFDDLGPSITQSNDGIQINFSDPNTGTLVSPGFGDEYIKNDVTFLYNRDDTGIQLGDYLFVYGSNNGPKDALCGQVRQILGVNDKRTELNVSSPRLGFAPDQQKGFNASYRIYPEWGKVVAFATCEGLNIITDIENGDIVTICDYGISSTFESKCISSIQEHKGRINFMFDNGRDQWGGVGFNKFFSTSDEQLFLGADKLVTASYRDYLIAFGKRNIDIAVFDENGFSNRYKQRDDIGIRSKYAYAMFDNGLYFISSDKKLRAFNLKVSGDNFILDLDDMSHDIIGDLDLIRDGDSVSISSTGDKLKIFITGRHLPENDGYTKTKILIFDKHYKLRYKHIVCSMGILGQKGKYFYGNDGLIIQCDTDNPLEYKDLSGAGGGYYTATIDFFISENENTGMQDVLGNSLDMFTKKTLMGLKVLLGKGVYTNDGTTINIGSYRGGYKTEYLVNGIEDIEWVNNWNTIYKGGVIKPSECVLADLEEGTNIIRPCEDSYLSTDDEKINIPFCLECQSEDVIYDDYCICVNDNAYALSPFYMASVPLTGMKVADMYRITINSSGGDVLNFGGVFAKFMNESIDVGDIDNKDKRGNNCLKKKTCPNKDC